MHLEDPIFPWLLLSRFLSLSVSARLHPAAVPRLAVGTQVSFLSATGDVKAKRWGAPPLLGPEEMGRHASVSPGVMSWDSERICLFPQGNRIVSDSWIPRIALYSLFHPQSPWGAM